MKKYFILACFAFLIFSQAAFASFSDVPEDYVYSKAINWLQTNEVVEGYPNGTFQPDKEVNRAEFLKMLYKTSGEDGYYTGKPIYEPFLDVEGNEWYGGYVTKAYMSGIIDGYPDGTFKPGNPINVAEALKIVMNGLLDKELFEVFTSNFTCMFNTADIDEVLDKDAWYYKYIDYADGHCVIPNNMVVNDNNKLIFDPGRNLTRGEMSEFLYRTKAIADNSTILPNALPNSFVSIFNPNDPVIEPDDIISSDTVGSSQYCTAEPVVTDIGRPVYPIASEYAHLPFLGQLFTAAECGKERLSEIFGVEDDNYTLGINLFTDGAPSEDLFELLKDMDFQCPQAVALEMCTMWILNGPVSLDDIMKFKPYTDEMAGDDCVDCG